jgi:probable lipoprotein NlpC
MRNITEYHPVKSFLLPLLAVVLLFCEGCITPYALKQKAIPDDNDKKPHLMVPADWDYRKYYKVPPERLKEIIGKYIGTPYRYGGTSPKGMDCSGFVKVVFEELNHARLPRTSYAMSRLGSPVGIKSGQPGDLVFFKTGILSRINHVGIYTGNGAFAHASRKKGVTFSELVNDYYKKRFAGIRRLF